MRNKRRGVRAQSNVPHKALAALALAACCVLSLGPHWNLLGAWELGVSQDAAILARRILERETDELVLDSQRLDQLGREIELTLTLIRDRYPETKEITARHIPATLTLGIEDNLLEKIAERWTKSAAGVVPPTGHSAFDDLNDRLELRSADVLSRFGMVVLHFAERANLRAARKAYSAIAEVAYASFGELVGDSSYIVVNKLDETWYVMMRKAWGDCPSGCMFAEYFFFAVKNGHVERMDGISSQEMEGFLQMADGPFH